MQDKQDLLSWWWRYHKFIIRKLNSRLCLKENGGLQALKHQNPPSILRAGLAWKSAGIFDIKGQEGTRLVSLQMWISISPCLRVFTCTKERMTLSALEKGSETCRACRFAMVICTNLSQSWDLSQWSLGIKMQLCSPIPPHSTWGFQNVGLQLAISAVSEGGFFLCCLPFLKG